MGAILEHNPNLGLHPCPMSSMGPPPWNSPVWRRIEPLNTLLSESNRNLHADQPSWEAGSVQSIYDDVLNRHMVQLWLTTMPDSICYVKLTEGDEKLLIRLFLLAQEALHLNNEPDALKLLHDTTGTGSRLFRGGSRSQLKWNDSSWHSGQFWRDMVEIRASFRRNIAYWEETVLVGLKENPTARLHAYNWLNLVFISPPGDPLGSSLLKDANDLLEFYVNVVSAIADGRTNHASKCYKAFISSSALTLQLRDTSLSFRFESLTTRKALIGRTKNGPKPKTSSQPRSLSPTSTKSHNPETSHGQGTRRSPSTRMSTLPNCGILGSDDKDKNPNLTQAQPVTKSVNLTTPLGNMLPEERTDYSPLLSSLVPSVMQSHMEPLEQLTAETAPSASRANRTGLRDVDQASSIDCRTVHTDVSPLTHPMRAASLGGRDEVNNAGAEPRSGGQAEALLLSPIALETSSTSATSTVVQSSTPELPSEGPHSSPCTDNLDSPDIPLQSLDSPEIPLQSLDSPDIPLRSLDSPEIPLQSLLTASPLEALIALPVSNPPTLAFTAPAIIKVSQSVIETFREGTAWLAKPVEKVPIRRLPDVWAENKQEIVEGTNYFKSSEGGVYVKDGIAKGYLLGGFPAPRDLWANNGRFIISHGGGKAVNILVEEPSGVRFRVTCLNESQAASRSALALMDNCRLGVPVVLLVDRDYALFPFKMHDVTGLPDVGYAVLGWYLITHHWAELEPTIISSGELRYLPRVKFAFQWMPGQPSPFFWDDITLTERACTEIAQSETAMNYEMLSVPLNPILSSGVSDSPDIDPDKRCIGFPKSQALPSPVQACISHPLSHAEMALDVESDPSILSGLDICSACGHYSQRIYQIGWMCLKYGCSRLWQLPDGMYPCPSDLDYSEGFLKDRGSLHLYSQPPHAMQPDQPHEPSRFGDCAVASAFIGGYFCRDCGRLSCREYFKFWKCANPQCGAEKSLNQWSALKIRLPPAHPSWPFGRAKVHPDSGIQAERVLSDGVATTIYVLPQNRGRIYHIHCTTLMQPRANELYVQYQHVSQFKRHPLRVHKGKHRILGSNFTMNAGRAYKFSTETENFTFEESPPCVLGALSFICDNVSPHIRLAHPFNEILSVAYLEGQHMNYHSDDEKGLGEVVAGLSLGSKARMDFRLKHSAAQTTFSYPSHTAGFKAPGNRDLSVILNHGDLLVMEGSEIQALYEHRVQPYGFRIAATARQIYPEHGGNSTATILGVEKATLNNSSVLGLITNSDQV